MNFSIEDIYNFSGQYDEIVCVTFYRNSESRKAFGDYIIGKFLYEPKERLALQKVVDIGNYQRNNGKIKFQVFQDAISVETKEILKKIGFETSEVSSIEQSSGGLRNNYASTDMRQLPDQIEIKIDVKNTDHDAMNIYLYDKFLKDGFGLAPFEVEIYYAAILNKQFYTGLEKNNQEHFLDNHTGLIKSGIRYYQLKSKNNFKEGLNPQEKAEFDELREQRATVRLAIVDKELEKVSENPKQIWTKYPQAINIVASFITYFEPIRLILIKFPIWLDFERFVHIYLGHTKAGLIGERNESNTLFQYSFKDTRRLIETVLNQIKEIIEQHFETKSGKSFNRQGAMAVHYNGDYYNINIASDGRLMTFYKSFPKPDGFQFK